MRSRLIKQLSVRLAPVLYEKNNSKLATKSIEELETKMKTGLEAGLSCDGGPLPGGHDDG